MRKIIAAINTTLDGICDHTAGIPDEEIHEHYTGLLRSAGGILYGRITYQLMEYWKPFINEPSGNEAIDAFAAAIHDIPKIVFSATLKGVDWDNTRLASRSLAEEVGILKEQPGKDILVGSRSLIIQLMQLGLVDEYQFCIHPVVAGGGLALFDDIKERKIFHLKHTKIFGGGAVILYYEPVR